MIIYVGEACPMPASEQDGGTDANYNAAYARITHIYAITHWHVLQSSLHRIR